MSEVINLRRARKQKNRELKQAEAAASRLLAESAAYDVEEARAARMPQATISGQVGGVDAGAPKVASTHGAQFQGGVSVSAPWRTGTSA